MDLPSATGEIPAIHDNQPSMNFPMTICTYDHPIMVGVRASLGLHLNVVFIQNGILGFAAKAATPAKGFKIPSGLFRHERAPLLSPVLPPG